MSRMRMLSVWGSFLSSIGLPGHDAVHDEYITTYYVKWGEERTTDTGDKKWGCDYVKWDDT